MPTDEELIHEAAQRLAETANPEKVIEELCVEHHLIWEDAHRLVDEAQETHSTEIVRRQSPILTLLALTSFSVGIALTAWHFMGILAFFSAIFDSHPPELLRILQVYSGFHTLTILPQAFALFITGIAMAAGSVLGMKDVWHGIFDAWERRNIPALEVVPPSNALKTPESGTDTQSASPIWMFLSLAALVIGGIWICQFALMASAYQSTLPPTIDDVFWGAFQRLWQTGGYVQRFPGSFVLFLLGWLLLAGGYQTLRTHWLALAFWYQNHL